MSGTIAHGILGFVSVAALVAVVSLPNWVSCHAALNGEWYEGMFAWSWKGIECDGFYFTAVDVADATEDTIKSGAKLSDEYVVPLVFTTSAVLCFLGFIFTQCGTNARSSCFKVIGISMSLMGVTGWGVGAIVLRHELIKTNSIFVLATCKLSVGYYLGVSAAALSLISLFFVCCV